MKKGTKKSGLRVVEPSCGHVGCDCRAEKGSWYCWRHAAEDLCDLPCYGDAEPMKKAA
jgi:hypothetical protein